VLGFHLSAGQLDIPGYGGGYNVSAHANLQYGGDAESIVRHSIQTGNDIRGRIHAMIAAGAHRGGASTGSVSLG
ncbi:SPON1, partial [Symbiodinium sp. CCMP2456]